MSILDELFELKDTEEFLDKFLEAVQVICRKKLSKLYYLNKYDKEDIMQDVLIKVYYAIDKYDKTISKPGAYFNRIVDNGITSCIRDMHRFKNIINTPSSVITDPEVCDEINVVEPIEYNLTDDTTVFDSVDVFIDFLENSNLTEQEKRIFNLRYSGLEFQEIAKIMGYTKARISQLWKNIINKCRSTYNIAANDL